MDDRVLTPDDARERLDAWKGRIDKLAADTKSMSDRFQALRVTKKDLVSMVEVTVDSSGSLVDLKLSRDIDRSSPDVLAGAIMSTIREAKAELAARTQEIIADTVGTDSPAARAIADQVGAHLRGEAGDSGKRDSGKRDSGTRDDANDTNDTNDLNIWR